ncbi:tRNA epoxyqueuosine(34) reductase QueG [Aestuariibacter salexigens]|uniref:tRNA epoxyqueuosine(34) reductase QueG n=1 Tax=Aestuariibacter salexigens TaxID=226010 RepID=UPI00047B60F1|nr:tRNA epoxyqueuosine(34) reductase QueG [Aestuariibacter salexigens]
MSSLTTEDLATLADQIKQWGSELGFQQVGISDIDLSKHKDALHRWLQNGYHGDMRFFEQNLDKRTQPELLHPGTVRAIAVRMDYLPPDASFAKALSATDKGYISRYALGRDYHKILRKRLKQLGDKIKHQFADSDFRPFVDSAPVLEHALAEKAGLGWTGKHSLTINKDNGSWFFLGELFINLPLPIDKPVEENCGSCTACMTICPTQAIVEPYVVDARRCISYLTIELKGTIPEQLRSLIGNRIYGCDDCQLVCPWNRYAKISTEADFMSRPALKDQTLLQLWSWDEQTFLDNTQGTAIRRIGYQRWRRNLAVGLGNAPFDDAIVNALQRARDEACVLVREHIDWALAQQHASKVSMSRTTSRLIRTIEKGLPRDA